MDDSLLVEEARYPVVCSLSLKFERKKKKLYFTFGLFSSAREKYLTQPKKKFLFLPPVLCMSRFCSLPVCAKVC